MKLGELRDIKQNKMGAQSEQEKIFDQVTLLSLDVPLFSYIDNIINHLILILQDVKIEHAIQLNDEISDLNARVKMLEIENARLKEDKSKLTKHFGQMKVDRMLPSLLQLNVFAIVHKHFEPLKVHRMFSTVQLCLHWSLL